ncbi:hypothetical protein LPICM17_350006 [Lactococcus piscium]|nr:hypothetical protein LPICM17_350006 [Lactococcus piscium]
MTKAVVLIDLAKLGGVISDLSISICHIISCLNPRHTVYFFLNLSSIFFINGATSTVLCVETVCHFLLCLLLSYPKS